MAKKSKVEMLAEQGYPADYEEALARELEGYRNRQAELRALHVREDDSAMLDAVSGEAAVLDELRRLGGGQEKAAKRPRAAADKRTSKKK